MQKSILFVLIAFAPFLSLAFTGQGLARSFVSKSSLSLGPLQKLANKGDYNKIVEGLMQTKGYTREQAEKEYNAYLDNPNDYALQKVRTPRLLYSDWSIENKCSTLRLI